MKAWTRELTVQITLAGLGDPAASLILILLEDTDLLKGLHDLAVNGAGGIDVVGWARATVAGGAVDLAKTADTDGLAEVDVAGDGRGADVVPVDGLRWELLGGTGLDRVNPTCECISKCSTENNFVVSCLLRLKLERENTYLGLGAFPVSSRKQSMR